jgi:triosephosphate isomerase
VTDLKRDLAAVKEVDIVVCPAFTALDAVSKAIIESNIRLGAQNMGDNGYGAFTGEIAPGMLRDLSVRYVILGHSERRQYQKESDELVARKAAAAHTANLIPIVCVGETLAERESGRAHDVIRTQLHGTLAGQTLNAAKLVIAYEPVWAIGTGRTATPDDAAEAHRTIRQTLADLYDVRFSESVRVIYGGSVNSKNAAELFVREEIDGGLVGGASLVAADFAVIVAAAAAKAKERSN